MYDELYNVWKSELENQKLQKLSSDFYINLALFFKKSREEARMLEKRSPRALLLIKQRRKAEAMLTDLAHARFKKINHETFGNKEIPVGYLTEEEKEIASSFSNIADQQTHFAQRVFQGNVETHAHKKENRIVVLRFVKDVPEIIGTDMRSYGPFQVENIGSLPPRNAALLIDKKLALMVDVH